MAETVNEVERRMSTDKKRKPEFGKRGRQIVEPTGRKATAVQRLQEMGSRWWSASGLPTRKKPPRVKRLKQARLRP